jgi:deazaflavin-dependent oxidoreductase (nitroreductase family)
MAGTTRIWFMRRLTTQMVNPVTRLFAGRLPGFVVLTHTGRTSGRRYRTPIFLLKRGDDYVFALTFGSNAHWVKNILAAGGCEIRDRGHDVPLVEPEVFVDPTRRLMPLPFRLAGRVLLVTEFLRVHAASRVGRPVAEQGASPRATDSQQLAEFQPTQSNPRFLFG